MWFVIFFAVRYGVTGCLPLSGCFGVDSASGLLYVYLPSVSLGCCCCTFGGLPGFLFICSFGLTDISGVFGMNDGDSGFSTANLFLVGIGVMFCVSILVWERVLICFGVVRSEVSSSSDVFPCGVSKNVKSSLSEKFPVA